MEHQVLNVHVFFSFMPYKLRGQIPRSPTPSTPIQRGNGKPLCTKLFERSFRRLLAVMEPSQEVHLNNWTLFSWDAPTKVKRAQSSKMLYWSLSKQQQDDHSASRETSKWSAQGCFGLNPFYLCENDNGLCGSAIFL